MKRRILCSILGLALAGCEAPLILDGVNETSQSQIRRTDVLLAASDNGIKSVVVGSEGVILTTETGQANWQRKIIETKPNFIDIASCDNGVIAALSMEGIVSVSIDNAETWSSHALETNESPQAISCDPLNRLWVVGSFTSIFSSTDNGVTWLNQSIEEDTILSTVQFVNDDKGFITGEFGTVLSTNDGGENWEFLEPIPNEFLPLNAVFLDSTRGWVVGLNGTVYTTEDGGSSWHTEQTGVSAPLFGIAIANDQLIAVGDYGTIIQRAIDAEKDSWKPMETRFTSRFFFRAGYPVNKQQLIIAGAAGSLEFVTLNETIINTDVTVN